MSLSRVGSTEKVLKMKRIELEIHRTGVLNQLNPGQPLAA